ncbi:DUF975 family protein [bacterium]|nr:DUF975 family protein [bacterium]
MERSELKEWAKKKREGNIIKILVALLVPSMVIAIVQAILMKIFGVQESTVTKSGELIMGSNMGIGGIISLVCGLAELVVGVNIIAYIVRIVKDKETSFKSLFDFSGNIVRTVLTMFLQGVFIFLWSLLFIIPGILKTYSYALVPYILADKRYKGLSAMEVLKLSEKLMKGHRWDYFVLQLSFIGWYILCPFTLGILYIWVVPYSTLAFTKFLQDLLDADNSTKSTKKE